MLNYSHVNFTSSLISYTVAVLPDACTGVTHLTSGIPENVDTLYEYLRLLASRKVNPLTMPPTDLCNILAQFKHDTRINS